MEKININSPCWCWQINTLTMRCKNYVWCHNMKFHKIPYAPHRRFSILQLLTPGNSSFASYFSSKSLGFKTYPLPPQEFPMTFHVRSIDTYWKHTINAEINYLLTVHLLDNNFFFQKKSIPTPWKVWEIPRGRGKGV